MASPTLARSPILLGLLCALLLLACSDTPEDPNEQPRASVEVDSDAPTLLEGAPGTAFEGVRVLIPAGALPDLTTVHLTLVDDPTPLPSRAVAVGAQFALGPDDLTPASPIEVTLPFDGAQVQRHEQDFTMVKIWRRAPEDETWALVEPLATSQQGVTVGLDAPGHIGAGIRLAE